MSGRGRNRRALLQLAALATLLPGALLGGLAVARGTCDVVLEPYPGRWMHHLEVHCADALDPEVAGWLAAAYAAAG